MRLLCYDDANEVAMQEEERASIECLWLGKSCVEASIGFIEGDRIVVTECPLIGTESVKKKIHPRRWQAVVKIELMGGIRRATIGLEILEILP